MSGKTNTLDLMLSIARAPIAATKFFIVRRSYQEGAEVISRTYQGVRPIDRVNLSEPFGQTPK